jgi:hypothetical protein
MFEKRLGVRIMDVSTYFFQLLFRMGRITMRANQRIKIQLLPFIYQKEDTICIIQPEGNYTLQMR